jgi:hypothetical protein
MARTNRTSRIAASVARAAGLPGAETMLARMQPSALGSLLLGVFRARAEGTTPSSVLAAASEGLFTPSSADGRLFHRFDAAALGAAQAFEALDVAPVGPFGACAALSGIDQNNVLTALRRAEVLADPTIALALAAAARRRAPAARQGVVRLCTSARLVRMQSLNDAPKEFTPHFRLFALVTAGRDGGEHRFETDALAEHIVTWLRLAEGLRREGFRIGAATVEISDLDAIAALCVAQGVRLEEVRAVAAAHRIGAAAEVLARSGAKLPRAVHDLRSDLGELHAHLPADAALRLERVKDRVFPAVAAAAAVTDVRLDLSRLEGLRYYRGLAFRISFDGPAGSLPVVDGGVVSWTQELLADRKERLVASAIGSEAVCKLYAPR